MKCLKCGAWSTVRETRERAETLRIDRRRMCANGHSFPTIEVHRTPEIVKALSGLQQAKEKP